MVKWKPRRLQNSMLKGVKVQIFLSALNMNYTKNKFKDVIFSILLGLIGVTIMITIIFILNLAFNQSVGVQKEVDGISVYRHWCEKRHGNFVQVTTSQYVCLEE